MKQMLKDKLQELGFSEKEVKIYLTMLDLGSAVASDIAKKADLKRSTAYVILDSLASRGLTSVVERRGVQFYTPAPPEQIVTYLRNMSSRYASLADTAKKLIPELKITHKTHTKHTPKIQMFQGLEGIKTVYQDMLTSLEDIRVYAGFKAILSEREAPATHIKHIKPEITVQTVFLDESSDHKRVAPDKEGLRKILVASRGEHTFSSEITVYDDRVVFISATENFALIAESKEFAAVLRNMCAASNSTIKEKKVFQPKSSPDGLTSASG